MLQIVPREVVTRWRTFIFLLPLIVEIKLIIRLKRLKLNEVRDSLIFLPEKSSSFLGKTKVTQLLLV